MKKIQLKIKNFVRPLIFGFLAKYFPKKHCFMMTKRGKIHETPFKIDLDSPTYFNEKLLWLKYFVYNKSNLIEKCYDKYLVREYVKECGCEETLNELYGVWDSIDDISWNELPDEYIIKVTKGCSHHIIKTKDTKPDIQIFKRILKSTLKERYIKYRTSGDLFAIKGSQKIICEKLLKNSNNKKGLDDWKFYCFNGEPKYLLYITDRIVASEEIKGSYKATFMTVDFKKKRSLFQNSSDSIPKKPKCYEKMLEYARKLSNDFPFVRVDFYVCNDKPIFGELTFTPAGSYVIYHIHNKTGLLEMGKKLNLNNISKYEKLNLKYVQKHKLK